MSRSLSGPSAMPILDSVLLTANSDLTVESNKLLVWRKDKVKAQVETEGAIAVPAMAMSKLLASIGGELTLQSNEKELIINSESGRYSFSLSPLGDFPEATTEDGDSFAVSSEVFSQQLKAILDCGVFPNRKGTPLDCIHLRSREGEAILEAMDGVGYVRLPLWSQYGGRPAIISLGAAKEALDISDGELRVTIGPNRITIASETSTVSARLVEGVFPDVDRMMTKPKGKWATLPVLEFARSLERAALLNTDSEVGVNLEFDGPKVSLSRATDRGSMAESVMVAGGIKANGKFDAARLARLVRTMLDVPGSKDAKFDCTFDGDGRDGFPTPMNLAAGDAVAMISGMRTK